MQGKRNDTKRKVPTGISERHSRSCALANGGDRCDCAPSYRAFVYDRRTHEIVRKTFSGSGALSSAKLWRADALSALGKGKNVTPSRRTLRQAADEWVAGAKAEPPTILNRSGRPYKPSVIRGYEADLNSYVLPDLGGLRLSDVRRGELQALVDRLVGQGLSSSKVRNVIIPIRVLFRHALEREEVSANPASGLRLPNGVGRRDRAASPGEASELLAVLPEDLRAIYATAFYGGLRRGELRGLRWNDVDLAKGIIHVRRAWDDYVGEVLRNPRRASGTFLSRRSSATTSLSTRRARPGMARHLCSERPPIAHSHRPMCEGRRRRHGRPKTRGGRRGARKRSNRSACMRRATPTCRSCLRLDCRSSASATTSVTRRPT